MTGIVDPNCWMDVVEQFCGIRPPDDEDARKSK